MKLFQKRPFAALVMVLAIAIGFSIACSRRTESEPVLDGEFAYVLHNEDGVLSDKTVRYIESMNESLFVQTGAQIVVDVVETTGTQDIVDYAGDMFERYGVGSRERDNGILLVLALRNLYNGAPDGDYYMAWGSGFSSAQQSRLETIFFDCLEDDFAAKRYDAGVRKTFDALIVELENLYGVTVREGNFSGGTGNYQAGSGYYAIRTPDVPFVLGNLIGLLILLFFIWVILDAFRYRRYRRRARSFPTLPYYPVFWGRPRAPRRPPPPPGPGFGGADRSGGFHGGGSLGGGARRPSGGFHSGGSLGGGARRSSGGFRSGGSLGGGARRPSGGVKAPRPSGGARRSGGSRPSGGARRR